MFCIGNSHLASVLLAAEEAGVSLHPIVFKESRYFDGLEHGVESIHPGQLVKSLTGRDLHGPVCSFIGGTTHLSKVFRLSPRPYDVFVADAPHLPVQRGAEIVPVNAVRNTLARSMHAHLEAIETLIDLIDGQVFHFEPPPPPAVAWWESTDQLDEGLPYLRYKLWRLNSEVVRELVERRGGTFVRSPPVASDEDGLLRAEYCANSTHANQAYGALVLEQMRPLL